MRISAVVFNTSRQELLEKCLASARFADEIILVNNPKNDSLETVAHNFNAKIVTPPKKADYVEEIREWAVKQAKGPWVLVLDGDEEVRETLTHTLIALTDQETEAWHIPRQNFIFGYPMQHTNLWPDYQLRFYQLGKVSWQPIIHQPPNALGKTGHLPAEIDNSLIHHNYVTVDDYLERIIKYTKVEQQTKPKTNKSISTAFYDDFLRRMLQDKGYLDGEVGAFVAISQAYYQMVVTMRQREHDAKNNTNELSSLEKFQLDLHYWLRTQQILRSKNPIQRLYLKIQRKLSL